MHCQLYQPSPKLENIIAYYWTLESDMNDNCTDTYRMIPDGYVDWVFHLKRPWSFCIPTKNKILKTYRSHLFGHLKNYLDLKLPDQEMLMLGVKFQPWAVQQIWNIKMCEVTDVEIAFSDLDDKALINLEEKMHGVSSIKACISLIENEILKRLTGAFKDNLEKTIKYLQYANHFSINDLALSKRRLEQRFQKEIGIAPKLFHRTMRINRLIQKMIRYPKYQLTDLAYEFNYFDQSHFIYDFKQFTGCTPSRFLKSINPSQDVFNFKINN